MPTDVLILHDLEQALLKLVRSYRARQACFLEAANRVEHGELRRILRELAAERERYAEVLGTLLKDSQAAARSSRADSRSSDRQMSGFWADSEFTTESHELELCLEAERAALPLVEDARRLTQLGDLRQELSEQLAHARHAVVCLDGLARRLASQEAHDAATVGILS